MKITLKHHQQIWKWVDSVWIYKDSSIFILVKVSDSKSLNDSLDNLRFSR